MRIVIDLQGFQGSNQQRGIGRYTLSLAQAIARNRGSHEVFIALNGMFPDTIETIRFAFEGLLPEENIRVWRSLEPVNNLDESNDWRRRSAEFIREAFLASLKPDIVLVSSVFEGLGDNVVTSIGALSSSIPTAAVLYDLIPLIQRSPYLDNPIVEVWYEKKLSHLRKADMLLAISESSRQEGLQYLGFSTEKCLTISTAVDTQFQPIKIDSSQEHNLRARYNVPRQFVMYTGGIDYRKNIEGLIRGYAKLPKALRAAHQLVIVCAINTSSRETLLKLAKQEGLAADELVLTGFVSEEDLLLFYNLCKVFIFPSWHEGFGLPALEAMSCGRAVIAANSSSLPEVIGRSDALFDPMSDEAITEKLTQVLTDDAFRLELEQHGLAQAKQFSWDTTAHRAIAGLEQLHNRKVGADIEPTRRPKMAYVSPLPPERSGISDYSAELLPELSRHYDIEVIVAQDSVSTSWINANCQIRSVAWFKANAERYDRVVYHFGNSHFHQHMFALLEEFPGVVVLHDFFLSGIAAHIEVTGYQPGYWTESLYQASGYRAVQQRFHTEDTADVVWQYPCNISVLRSALALLVHSENSRRLANQWYGEGSARDWFVIPHLRASEIAFDKLQARRQLDLADMDFVICSFGLLGSTKLNHRLLDAWLASELANDKNCLLVFVGENQEDSYGQALAAKIRRSGMGKRVCITGWADTNTFRQYLAAADIGVQLRTLSRGETSGTVLDCMNYALPTIVNANGSMADLPDDAVWKLPDEFTDVELVTALETLWRDQSYRQALGNRARETILTRHAPSNCADMYKDAIESAYFHALNDLSALSKAIAGIETLHTEQQTLLKLAREIDLSIPSKFSPKQLFVDISELVLRDSKSGIQRVVRNILRELLEHPPEGYRVEPVYASHDHAYRYARRFTLGFLNCPELALADEVIEFRAGDIFLGLDLQPHVVPAQRLFYQQLRNFGVKVQFLVYDLLPILMPKFFSEGASKQHQIWLEVVIESDGAICISNSVADELDGWIRANGYVRRRNFKITSFHLGADLDGVNLSPHVSAIENNLVIKRLSERPTFLMVGTIEPRKGYAQTIAAFEMLWNEGVEVNLVIVGKIGWMMDSMIHHLNNHPELEKRLFWLQGINDEYLEKVYAASDCLIAASEGEGFGLPLIESAQHKLPIIARDIPVFREVAGQYAYYFSGLKPQDLAGTIKSWLESYAKDGVPRSDNMPWLNWNQSTQQLLATMFTEQHVVKH